MNRPDTAPYERSLGRQPLILASASPRRRELLARLVDAFVVEPADIDEARRPGEAPREYVMRMAREKAEVVAARHPGRCVLGADTTVTLDEECLGKPDDAQAAAVMLQRLSGRAHHVLTSVWLVLPEAAGLGALSTTEVNFADVPSDWIASCIKSGEPMDKAGAYAIQGSAAVWIARLNGSYTGVVGLPLFETADLLRKAGLTGPDPSLHARTTT
ncbi:MAG: Maf family protein [Xanthomonadaceae bacterium]|nr:Maf family protein [Xanthomonadaceae bacterium]